MTAAASSLLAHEAFLGVTLLIFAAALTEMVRLLCIKAGFISRPATNRWSQRVVALGGGISIQLSILAGMGWLGGRELVTLAPAFAVVFLLGLIDDFKGINPSGKLLVQTVAAAWVVSHGYVLPSSWQIIAITVTIVWIVGVTNAVNLIDNMDGLAAGTTVVAGLALAALFAQQGDSIHCSLCVVVAAAAAGFLLHNFYPARIFMGDAGSLPLGFVLAALATKLRFSGDIHQSLTLIPIAMVLVVPLFDVALVMVARRNAHRPLMSGDAITPRIDW